MTLEEISALTIETNIYDILNRLLDFSSISNDEVLYEIDSDDSLDFYDRVSVHSSLTKPTLSQLENELDVIKAELTAIENARLAEIARVNDINTRWEAMVDVRGAISKAGLLIQNPALELKRIIETDDQTQLTLLETKYAEFQTELTAQKNKESRKQLGVLVRKVCDEILDVIAGFNVENNFTTAQKDQMESDYSGIIQALSIKRPMKAKSLIQAIDVSTSIFTQEIKDEILDIYTQNGL